MPGGEGAIEKRRRFAGVRRHDARHEEALGNVPRQEIEAAAERLVDERIAVEVQAIEEERLHRQRPAKRVDVELAAEPAHGDLERMRRAVTAEGDRLAVEDDLSDVERSHRFDHFRDSDADVAEVARVHANLVARLVHLDPGAIQLELDRRAAEIPDRGADAVRRVGQHRLDRRERPDDERGQRGFAFDERRAGDGCQRSREHRGAPHGRWPDVRRAGNRLHQHAFERPLPQLAEQQPCEEVLLVFGRPFEQAPQRFGARPSRPGSRERRDLDEGVVDIRELERGVRRRRRVARCDDRGGADADAPLPRRAAQERNHGLDFLSRSLAKEVGEPFHLLQPAAGFRDARGRLDDGRKAHPSIVTLVVRTFRSASGRTQA